MKNESQKLKILLIGSGGREHALSIALSKSDRLEQLFIAPGNAGTGQIGRNIPISDSDIDRLLEFARANSIDLVIVGPEVPLVAGIVDRFKDENIKIVGPTQAAARLEGSKKWAKMIMKSAGVPTAAYETFSEYQPAIDYVHSKNTFPIVIKADGLAAGKGVVVAQNLDEADFALKNCFILRQFAEAGNEVVIEDFLMGEEASVLAFSDGKTIKAMPAAQDHKAIWDGDKGPNTGGMGSYCPAPLVTPEITEKIQRQVLEPMITYMNQIGVPFTGILFAGLMIHNNEPSVVEFNVRFGDPETQSVLPLLETDLIDIFEALTESRLDQVDIQWKPHSAVCVVLAANGYPSSYPKGEEITGTEAAEACGVTVVHAGTTRETGTLTTNGGRVMGVVACEETLSAAIEKAYQGVDKIEFISKYFRTDIGQKAFNHKGDA
jgi:phosphoribosylamine--glycine ligase